MVQAKDPGKEVQALTGQMTKGDALDLLCHNCRDTLLQFGYSIDESTRKKWYFLCSNGCPLKYTMIEEPFEQEQVNIILNKQTTSKEKCN